MKSAYLDFKVSRCRDRKGKFATCSASEEYFRKIEDSMKKNWEM